MLKSTEFIFDGVPSETFGLMIYFLDDSDRRELSLGTDVDVVEDRLPKRTTPIHYGVDLNKSMSFPLTFGSKEYLKDYDVDAILSWLTGHQQYKWLEFIDGDHYIRYKCHLNNMQTVYINGLATAFTCDVECDSQFAYEYPRTYIYEIDTTEAYIEFLNSSSYNGYLYPKIHLDLSDDCNSFTIRNETDNNREFKINYFDRIVYDTNAQEYVYNTSLAKEASDVEVNDDFISWQVETLPTSGDYAEIIKGEVSGSEIWVALPQNGNIALFSEDLGSTWQEASPTLPHSGGWTGCFGDSGFVAICTDDDTAIASYSQTGKSWTVTEIELPVAQKWRKVIFVETDSFMPNQYLAIGGINSSIAAISMSGWAWQISSLPVAQEWRSAFAGNDTVIMVGGNTNSALISADCVHWEEITLPRNAAWSAGCHGTNGFIMIADTLYGSGSREPIALKSTDGRDWEIIEFPVGCWSEIVYGNSAYMAVADRQYAYSLDGNTWTSNTLPANVDTIIAVDGYYLCPLNSNKYITSSSDSMIKGSFDLVVPADPSYEVSNVYVSAFLDNTVSDTSYASTGIKLLATNIEEVIENGEVITAAEVTGGEYVAVTTDLRYGLGIDGVMMSATYNEDTRTATINYIADSNHTSVINAPLEVIIQFDATSTTDLGYDGLSMDFDNENQIITTNKESLNMYEYFNKRFFRLVKGMNKLYMKTDSGSCKVTITCEFLRKVGGR